MLTEMRIARRRAKVAIFDGRICDACGEPIDGGDILVYDADEARWIHIGCEDGWTKPTPWMAARRREDARKGAAGAVERAFDYPPWSVDPAEIRQRAIELEVDLWPGNAEDHRGAAELLAAFADYDPALLRRALLGEAGSGSAGRDLLADAIECAEDESGC